MTDSVPRPEGESVFDVVERLVRLAGPSLLTRLKLASELCDHASAGEDEAKARPLEAAVRGMTAARMRDNLALAQHHIEMALGAVAHADQALTNLFALAKMDAVAAEQPSADAAHRDPASRHFSR